MSSPGAATPSLGSLIQTFMLNYIKSEVCYPPYGCFNRAPPFNAPYIPLPDDPKNLDTSFRIYNRENSGDIQRVFNSKQNLKVIIHGFTENGNKPWMRTMADEILKKEDSNVILVNWMKGAMFPYEKAVGNIRIVGSQTAYLIEYLIGNTNLQPENVHLIGFSLGSHIVGNIGNKLKMKNMKVGRITGLDPAGPFFTNTPTGFRLDPEDADFVDAIHTNANQLGIMQPSGNSDFYPNGGMNQPGCNIGGALSALTSANVENLVACCHFRAVYYYIESIRNQDAFMSTKCNSYQNFQSGKCNQGSSNQMGFYTKMEPGVYYLSTNSQSPYSV